MARVHEAEQTREFSLCSEFTSPKVGSVSGQVVAATERENVGYNTKTIFDLFETKRSVLFLKCTLLWTQILKLKS